MTKSGRTAAAAAADETTRPGSGDAEPRRETRAMRKRSERVRLIEHTAARLFAQRGYEATNFEDIGATLDLRGPSLYHYFASKEELFLRCMDNAAAEVFPRLTAIAAAEQPAIDRLRLMFREEAAITLREYPEFLPLFIKVQVPVPALEQRRNELRRQQTQIFRDVVDELRPGPHGPTAAHLHMTLNLALGGLALIGEWFNPADPMSIDDFADAVSQSLITLFRPDGVDT